MIGGGTGQSVVGDPHTFFSPLPSLWPLPTPSPLLPSLWLVFGVREDIRKKNLWLFPLLPNEQGWSQNNVPMMMKMTKKHTNTMAIKSKYTQNRLLTSYNICQIMAFDSWLQSYLLIRHLMTLMHWLFFSSVNYFQLVPCLGSAKPRCPWSSL